MVGGSIVIDEKRYKGSAGVNKYLDLSYILISCLFLHWLNSRGQKAEVGNSWHEQEVKYF